MRDVVLLLLMVLAATVFAAPEASADTITYEWSGNITSVDAALGSYVSTTDSASGTITIDDAGATDTAASATLGRYAGQVTYTLTLGTGTWSGSWRVDVRDDYKVNAADTEHDGFVFATAGGDTISGTTFGALTAKSAGIDDRAASTTVWSTDSIDELFTLTLSDWPSVTGALSFSDGSLIRFDVTSLTAVPEPASVALVGLGGLLLAAAARRRGRQRA